MQDPEQQDLDLQFLDPAIKNLHLDTEWQSAKDQSTTR